LIGPPCVVRENEPQSQQEILLSILVVWPFEPHN
jgi:hypothetical protein